MSGPKYNLREMNGSNTPGNSFYSLIPGTKLYVALVSNSQWWDMTRAKLFVVEEIQLKLKRSPSDRELVVQNATWKDMSDIKLTV